MQCSCVLNRLQHDINVTFKCTRKPENAFLTLTQYSLYCSSLEPNPQPPRYTCNLSATCSLTIENELLRHVWLFVTPWTAARQLPLSMGFSVHRILQARILEWVAISFPKGSSQPRDQAQVFCIAGRFFTGWAIREVSVHWLLHLYVMPLIFRLSLWAYKTAQLSSVLNYNTSSLHSIAHLNQGHIISISFTDDLIERMLFTYSLNSSWPSN